MKSIKFLIMLVCMILGLANVSIAQVYCSEVCFYQRIEDQTYVYAIKFENSTVLRDGRVKQNITTSLNYYDNDAVWGEARKYYKYEYDPEVSSSKYEVYSQYCSGTADLYGNPILPAHTEYVAFSKDLSSCVRWRERNSDGSIFDKVHYIRISKEDILPKAVNRDFLND